MRLLGIAFTTVRRMPLRSTLTAMSLILGVMALTSVAAAQEVMSQTITRAAILAGGPAVTSEILVTDQVDPVAAANRWQQSIHTRYAETAITAVIASPSGLSVSVDGTTRPDIAVRAVDRALINICPFDVLEGTWFWDENSIAPLIVVNDAAAGDSTSNSWSIRWGVSGQRMTANLIGVVDDGSAAPNLYLDLSQQGPWADYGGEDVAISMVAHIDGVNDSQLRSALTQTQGISGLTGQLGEIRRTDTVGTLSAELDTNARVFIAVSVVALVIAGVGMLNIGLSTLSERSDELSLRRAFGAHRSDIVALMLLEAQLVALVAGGIGVLAAYIAMPYTLTVFGTSVTDTAFPSVAALAGVCSGSLAALAGAATPAIRAMNTPIATIMRG